MVEIIIKKWTVASVQVVYYIPDYLHIVNEFVWQTEDQIPEFPRITKFLDYWDKNIDGPIKEVYIYCLLYTSPSPRDGLLSRMPSSA